MNQPVAKLMGSSGVKLLSSFQKTQARSTETINLRKNKRKKLCIQPGQSITSKAGQSDKEYYDIDQPSTSKCNSLNGKINTASYSKKTQHKKVCIQLEEATISSFSKDDFVIVNLLYTSNSPKKQMKTFYAQVLDVHENMTDTTEPIK